jgi:holo-[acyl-carrier protein] synthase
VIRIGVDVVDIARFAERIQRWPRLVERVFTPAEQQYCLSKRHPAQHFAARFAAKEAAFKALGEGWPRLSWTDVEVVSESRRPVLVLRGRAAEMAGECNPLVSLSHDAGVAISQVVLVDRGRNAP